MSGATALPERPGPPGWTQAEIYWCEARLATATRSSPIFVGQREWALLRAFAEWKHDRQPITENPTLEPL